ncbi:MAG: tRNA-intron lyase [Nitrososphaeraceae archaeon]|nr:tRNA-intron lyase [Nitrososphaeraceae archaeon]
MSGSVLTNKNNCVNVEQEYNFTVDGRFEKNRRIVIDSVQQQDQLRNKGFGEKINDIFFVEPYEALFLLYNNRLNLNHKNKLLDFSELAQIVLKTDESIFTKFLIYRDLRTRGYIAKEGFGFGLDFRVYERGEYQKKPAKYVVFGINEGLNLRTKDLKENITSIENMGKEGIIAVIERRGEIIYYKINRKRFEQNSKLICLV